MYRILTLIFVFCLPALASAQPPTAMAEKPSSGKPTSPSNAERTIEFSFDKADWKDVVPWFAEQTGYSWQPISEWPEGTFTLSDEQKYTPLEALDQINYALRLRQPPYTIVRNRNQLILTEASSPLPGELIETISPAQLDQRGDYEIVTCHFPLGDIDGESAEDDLLQAVSDSYKPFAKMLPTANEFHARETGANLRKIRDIIIAMTKRKATSFSTYSLKHYDPEQFLIVSRRLLDIPSESYQRDDGSLVVTVDPSSNRMILKGTPTAIEEFKNIAAVIDIAVEEEDINTERPFLKSYPVFTDPEVARKVMETMLDGTDATVGQDGATGAIVLRGRKEHHKLAAETISTLRGEAGTTKIVQLENASASSILSAVQSLMNSSNDAENPQGPKLLANTVQNYIVIRGTPAEIFEVSQTIIQLDQAQQLDPNRVRSNARVIRMAPAKRDDLIESVQDYWPTTGRKNSLRIIMPEDRDKTIGKPSRFRNSVPRDAAPMPADGESTSPTATPNVGSVENAHLNDVANRRTISRVWNGLASGLCNFHLVSMLAYTPETEDASEGNQSNATSNYDYTPPEVRPSIPGSPVTIKGTAFGILIESDDLDALDDLETILMQEVGEEGSDQGLTVFYLKYKKAASIKSALETMFGLGGSSSGGGGSGDLLSGIVGNVAGEGAGDLLGGVLGGSGTSNSGAVISLEGDVQIGMYVPLNLIYVSGATQTDLEIIQDAVDTFDVSTAPQNPELAGQFFAIQVRYRDPEEIMARIPTLMADYIQSENNSQEGEPRGGANASDQVARMVRNISRGRGRGSSGESSSEESTPRIRLDLDKETDQILITGPEFIYKQIKALVMQIDTPKISSPKRAKILPSGTFTAATLKIIQQKFGSKVVTVAESEIAEDAEAAEGSSTKSTNAQTSQRDQSVSDREREAQRQRTADFFRNLRRNQGAQQGGARGGNTGGGRPSGGGRQGGGRPR